jgi:hypothetical protein
MSASETLLDSIRERREIRDRILFRNILMSAIKQLRQTLDTWVDAEFHDLDSEIELIDRFATRSASERISNFKTQLSHIQNEDLPSALKQLDELIGYIEKQEYTSTEEFMNMVKHKLESIVSVIVNVYGIRPLLDGMADMIPLPSSEVAEE